MICVDMAIHIKKRIYKETFVRVSVKKRDDI